MCYFRACLKPFSTPIAQIETANHFTKNHTGNSLCDVLQLQLNLVIASYVVKLGSCDVSEFGLRKKFYRQLKAICIYIENELIMTATKIKLYCIEISMTLLIPIRKDNSNLHHSSLDTSKCNEKGQGNYRLYKNGNSAAFFFACL